jgi:S-DNA-T family DNA segregation ATPase FtsK/SpoIIIE
VGIEVPNISRTTLGLGPLLSEEAFGASDKPLLMALGRSITGAANFADLAKMPHMLVAGATGSGKSVTIHDLVVSLLYRCGPERLRFIMVDPKRVELTLYNSIPHLLTPVITDAKKCILALKWLAKEMERRYNILETETVRDISSYHQNVVAPALEKASKGSDKPLPEAMPYIVLIIDELADIMSSFPRELESGIVRLAQMSRAVGIHLILSTQRPSVKVITGLIKANIPARVALQVSSQIDSRTILDGGGAEKLLGAGDMLFLSGEMSKPKRIQAAFITEDEVKRVVAHIAKHAEGTLPDEINFDESANRANDPVFSAMQDEADGEGDELYGEAKKTVIEAGKASTSYLQRKLGIGYARAAKLMDILEEKGVIGPSDGAKPRDVIGAGNADELAAEPAGDEEEPAI